MTRLASFLLAGALMAAPAPQTFTGVITCTMCGKDHKHMGVTPDSKCVVECIKHDKSSKYALLVGERVYVLSDQETPAKFAARKVNVTGTLYEKTGIIKVEAIRPAR